MQCGLSLLHYATATVSAITQLIQTALTTVVVTWTPPPEALVTEYTVRYRLASGNGSDGNITVSQGSAITDINDLTNGETYTFSIEATASNMLPGVSDEMTITLGECTNYISVAIMLPLPLWCR